MSWPRFLTFNAAGAIVWAGVFGLGAYACGKEIHRVAGPIGAAFGPVALIMIVAGIVFLRRNETRLEEEAERALPGPLNALR